MLGNSMGNRRWLVDFMENPIYKWMICIYIYIYNNNVHIYIYVIIYGIDRWDIDR